jgi:hypothetical protein
MKDNLYDIHRDGNPQPDLQALAQRYGGLGNVPDAVLDAFQAEREQWEVRRKFRHLDEQPKYRRRTA